jgi:hypothetical protein
MKPRVADLIDRIPALRALGAELAGIAPISGAP